MPAGANINNNVYNIYYKNHGDDINNGDDDYDDDDDGDDRR